MISMSKDKSHLIVGIDIGSNTTKLCAVTHSENPNIIPEILDLVEVESQGVYKGNIIDEKELINTLYKIIKETKENIFNKKTHILLSLNAAGINSVINNGSILNSSITNEITKLDLERLEKESAISVANIKNKKIIHTIPIRYKIDNNEITNNPIGMIGKRIEGKFLFIFSPTLYVENLEKVFSQIKINIEDIVVGTFAESVVILNKKQKTAGTGLINIGHSTTSIIVYENSSPILTSILGVGSNDLTNDIALGLQVSLEDAENIKIGKSDLSYSKRKLEEIIEARLEFICEKINLELSKINRKELLPGGIILTGGGSKLSNIDQIFKNNLKLPIKFANQEIREYSNNQIIDSCYARVYGLTFLAPIVSTNYSIKNIFKNIFLNIQSLFKKILP